MLIISLTHPATSCQRRWKTTIHNITIWLFLDTEGENRLYSGPKKGEFLHLTWSSLAKRWGVSDDPAYCLIATPMYDTSTSSFFSNAKRVAIS